jgi:hypothetical protein
MPDHNDGLDFLLDRHDAFLTGAEAHQVRLG